MKVKPVAGRLNHSCYGELELSSWSNQLRHVGQSGSHTEESDVETRGRKRGREKEGGRKRERESGSKRVQKRKTVREEKREVVKKIIKQDEIRNISSNKEYTNSEGGGGGGLDLNVLHNQFCLIYFSIFHLTYGYMILLKYMVLALFS